MGKPMSKAQTTGYGGRVLAKSERRYIAKKTSEGRSGTWGVYDLQRGCWPVTGPEWGGDVKQTGHSEATAQAEADRLEGLR